MLLMEKTKGGGDQLCVGGYVEEQLTRPLCGSVDLSFTSELAADSGFLTCG